MLDFMKNYENQTYALMRITTGFMFLCHGVTKFQAIEESARPWHIQWLAGPIELIGGALVMLGLFTVPAAFLCAGMAAAAYWIGHFPNGMLPIQNRGDAAALYAFAFLFISAKGTGIWGLGKQ
jgi:putative oxidoreductase